MPRSSVREANVRVQKEGARSGPLAVLRVLAVLRRGDFLVDLFHVPEHDFGDRIHYEKDALKLWEDRGKYDLMIFHARPKTTDVTDVADEKGFMPPKSTYFYPKLASGLVLRQLS